jgi:hypothetical protein
MAATCITIVREYLAKKAYTEKDRELFAHALDYAPGMGSIGACLYRQLHEAVVNMNDVLFREALQHALDVMLPKWEALGQPRSEEKWRDAVTEKHGKNMYWSDQHKVFMFVPE